MEYFIPIITKIQLFLILYDKIFKYLYLKLASKQRPMKHFKLLSQLGIGSFGKVQLALHIQTGEKVAIKTISKQKLKTKQDALMVSKQIAVFKSVRHENIIKLYQIIEDENYLFLVMEYADKGDLLNHLKNSGLLSETVALKFMKQMIAAIKYLHIQKSIAHRDVKLANVLLTSTGNIIKLADFGLSNFYDKSDLKLRTSCGSPCYSAPQILKGRTYCPIQADIWSLGVVLYAMVEGTLPFYDDNVKQLYKQVMKGKYFPMEKGSEKLKNLIRRILVVNPELRISIQELQVEIKQMATLQEHPKKENKNSSLSIPKLSLQSNQYIQTSKVELIRKIMLLKGFPQAEIESLIRSRKQNQKPYKFNHTNTYLQLLNKKPFNKLRQLVNNCYIQSKQNERSQQLLIQLKRTHSNYTRDTLKSSTRDEKNITKTKFVRNGNIGRASFARRQCSETSNQKTFKIQGLVIRKKIQLLHKGKEEQIQRTKFECKDITKQYNSVLNSIGQSKNGYIRIKSSNNFVFESALSEARNSLQVRNKKHTVTLSLCEEPKSLTKSKSKKDVGCSIVQTVPSHQILTDRSYYRVGTNPENNTEEMSVFKGPFNIMHTFNGSIQQVNQSMKSSFKDSQELGNFKYSIECEKTQKNYTVEIMKAFNFTNLKIIKVQPFSSEILHKVKQTLNLNKLAQSQLK